MTKNLEQLIERYLAADTTRKQGAAKGALTKWVNSRAETIGAIPARNEILEALTKIQDLPEWITKRFNTKSFYQEGDRVMGWWNEASQCQVEQLPLVNYGGTRGYCVDFWMMPNQVAIWQSRGFYTAQGLPIKSYGEQITVDFDVKQSNFWAEYGYALPCDLQWWWREGEEFRVCRSIISSGFWSAYKWWEGCKWWYYEKHPEWFLEDDLWGDYELTPVWHPAPDEFSAVLGGTPAPH